jgi:hypothetical protein
MRTKAVYICNCIDLDLEALDLTKEQFEEVYLNAEEINKKTFLRNCEVDYKTKEDMLLYPNDYQFFRKGFIYFYVWSAIEYYYKYEDNTNDYINKFTDEENNNLNQKTGFINLSEDKTDLLSLNNVGKHLNRGISIYN